MNEEELCVGHGIKEKVKYAVFRKNIFNFSNVMIVTKA